MIETFAMAEVATIAGKAIAGLLGLATTIWGGKHVWGWYKSRNDNDTAVELQREANRHQRDSDQFSADIASGTRAERALKVQIDDLKKHIEKLEERMDRIEQEKDKAVLRVANLEAEGKVKDNRIHALQNKLDAACKILKEKGVDDSIIDLLRNEKL